MMTYPQKTIERRHGAARNHVESAADGFGLGAFDGRLESERLDGLHQEFRAEPPRLDQGHGSLDEAGDNNSRQAGPRSDVGP